MALEMRLAAIWRRRSGSPRQAPRASGSISTEKARPFSVAGSWKVWRMLSATLSNAKSCWESSRRPASILERSRTSLMTASSSSPEVRMTPSRSRCLSLISSKAMTSAIASTPFSGVRISWLMLARNCDLSTLAALAWSRATTSSPMAWRRLVSFSSSLTSSWLKLRARLRKRSSSAAFSSTGVNLPLAATRPMASDRRWTGAVIRRDRPRARKRASPEAPKNSAKDSAA